MGRGSLSTAARTRRRVGAGRCGRDRRHRGSAISIGGEGCDDDHSCRVHERRRPRRDRAGLQPESARRQCYRREHDCKLTGREAVGTAARACAQCPGDRVSGESELFKHRSSSARRERGHARPRTYVPRLRRGQRARPRIGLRRARAIADQEIRGAQLAFGSAEDLRWTFAFDVADDRHVGADTRGRSRFFVGSDLAQAWSCARTRRGDNARDLLFSLRRRLQIQTQPGIEAAQAASVSRGST